MSILVETFVKNPQAISKLEEFEIDQKEKEKIAEMLVLLYHQQLLNRFLECLEENDKQIFFEKHLTSQEEAVGFLKEKIENIEEVVTNALKEIEQKLLNDLEELKRNENLEI